MAKINIGGRGRMKSQLSPQEQKEVNRRWKAAHRASKLRLVMARTFGNDSDEAKQAWIAEEKAWALAIPMGGW